MNIITTIIPIFSIIILGWFARQRGFIPGEFLEPANRLVYYIAIPAMIFRSISSASLKTELDIRVVVICLFSLFVLFVFALAAGKIMRIPVKTYGSFVQCSFHGNLGYIGLAVSYYFLGQAGFVKAGILAGFIMIAQNFLAVTVLQLYSETDSKKKKAAIFKVLGNPIILSAAAGMLFASAQIPVPVILGRSLDILTGMALPLALLIIGASLSFDLMQLNIFPVLITGIIKLILLPGTGFAFYKIFNLGINDYLPGLILLASPTATISFVMAKEMHGDSDFAVAAISTSTILSAVTFSVWLKIAAYF